MLVEFLVIAELDHQYLTAIQYNQPVKVTLVLPLILRVAPNEWEKTFFRYCLQSGTLDL